MRRDKGDVEKAVKHAMSWRDDPQPQIPKNRQPVIFDGVSYSSVKDAMIQLGVTHIVYSTVCKRMKRGEAFQTIITNPKILGREHLR